MQGYLLPGCGGKNDSPASLLLSMRFEGWSLVTATGAQRFFFAGKTRFATEIPPSHDGLTIVIQMTDSVLLNATRTNHIRLLAVMNQTKRRQMLREVPVITCPTQVNWGTQGMLGPRSTVGQLQRHPLPHCSHQKNQNTLVSSALPDVSTGWCCSWNSESVISWAQPLEKAGDFQKGKKSL